MEAGNHSELTDYFKKVKQEDSLVKFYSDALG
jgi:hypothetical protein